MSALLSTRRPWTTHDSNLVLHRCLSTATPTKPALPTELILLILTHPSRLVELYSANYPPPSRQPDQNNRHAVKKPEDCRVELEEGHELLRQLGAGDRIHVWACAIVPGLDNQVYEARISLQCVDDLTGNITTEPVSHG